MPTATIISIYAPHPLLTDHKRKSKGTCRLVVEKTEEGLTITVEICSPANYRSFGLHIYLVDQVGFGQCPKQHFNERLHIHCSCTVR